MPVSTAPPTGTGPRLRSQTSTKSLRDRIEKLERDIKRLQANRNPQTFALAQLTNTAPMAQVADGQAPVYDKTSGQYKPTALGYASLTGPGEDEDDGQLTQTGPFVVSILNAELSVQDGDIQIVASPSGTVTVFGEESAGLGSGQSTVVCNGFILQFHGEDGIFFEFIDDLPTSDPMAVGQLWLSLTNPSIPALGGTLMVSGGS